MEVQVSKENICINKLVAEKKELIFVNNDMIVPEFKPDILNTIKCIRKCMFNIKKKYQKTKLRLKVV